MAITATSALAAPIAGPRSVGGFYSSDDGASHAIIATTNNDVYEAYWWETTGVSASVIYHAPAAITAVSAFFSPWDNYRHAIVAQANGDVVDVSFNPCCGITHSVITSLSGWGGTVTGPNTGIKSISAWLDPQKHLNIAFLTHWGTADVLGIYQRPLNGTGTATFVQFYDNDSAIDVAGHHEVWNSTSMVSVAAGSPSHIDQLYWNDNTTAANYFTISPSTNIPWATRFPGNGPATTITSLTGSDAFCYSCSEFGPVEQLQLVTSANNAVTYATNNGGGVYWNDYPYGTMRSIAGPFTSPVSGSNYRRNTIITQTTGYVWNMTAVWGSGTPAFTWRNLGLY